jgi:hypothetical protein
MMGVIVGVVMIRVVVVGMIVAGLVGVVVGLGLSVRVGLSN